MKLLVAQVINRQDSSKLERSKSVLPPTLHLRKECAVCLVYKTRSRLAIVSESYDVRR